MLFSFPDLSLGLCWNYFNLLLLHNCLILEIECGYVLEINGYEIINKSLNFYCLEWSTVWVMWLKYYIFAFASQQCLNIENIAIMQCFNCVLVYSKLFYCYYVRLKIAVSNLFSSILRQARLRTKLSCHVYKNIFWGRTTINVTREVKRKKKKKIPLSSLLVANKPESKVFFVKLMPKEFAVCNPAIFCCRTNKCTYYYNT